MTRIGDRWQKDPGKFVVVKPPPPPHPKPEPEKKKP
jgi:hypothetical protein